MPKVSMIITVALVLCSFTARVQAFDHPGHMMTAAIAFAEIERERPDLIDVVGVLFLTHPDPAPFWVATGDAKGEERIRRMFIEAARWPDDSKFTNNDRLTWHTARWAVLAKDAPPEAKATVAARRGSPLAVTTVHARTPPKAEEIKITIQPSK